MLEIRMVRTPEVSKLGNIAAFFGIEELVRELTGYPPDVRDYGVTGWPLDHLIPTRGQLDISGPLTRLETEYGKYDDDPHIDVVLTAYDLCNVAQPDLEFCIGAASGQSIVVSEHHFIPFLQKGEEGLFHELVKQETAHELGHVLGLADRDHLVYEALGGHCAIVQCVMHQGLTVPTDWVTAVEHRHQNGGRYACPECHRDAFRNGML